MIEVIYTLIALFILGVLAGLAAFWLHWIIGAPYLGNADRAQYQSGRILSFLGRYVARKFNERAEWIGRTTFEQAQGADFNEKLRHQAELAEKYTNWWFAAGGCIVCFAVHISNIIFLICWSCLGLDWVWLLFMPMFTGLSLTVTVWQNER